MNLFGMHQITKDTVLAAHKVEPRRKCFQKNSGLQKMKARPTFSVSIESAKLIFESQTGLELSWSENYQNYWRFVNSDEIRIIEEWERDQCSLIFLRDCLMLSAALDTNFTDTSSGRYTSVGELEDLGKNQEDRGSIEKLAELTSNFIQRAPYYRDADLICSVPPRPGKEFDLPSKVTELVSGKVQKPNITTEFIFGARKDSVKTASFERKWQVWEDSKVLFRNKPPLDVEGKKIILIDDKYQSGITIQYIAMLLQQSGATEIYGLSFVKTMRDSDNM